MAYDITAMARAKGIRRNLTIRPIEPARSLEQDLARLYLNVVKAWNADEILRGYTGGLTTDAPSDQTNTIAQAEDTVTRLIAEFTRGLRAWVVRAEAVHRSRFVASIKAGTGIDLSFMLMGGEVAETLHLFIDRNTALVRDISSQAQGKISDAVWRGYQQRLPARDVAKEIRDATGFARARSIRVASDQNSKLSAALDNERQAEAGIDWIRWRSSHKKHFRPHHAARDGKVYDRRTGKARDSDEVVPADDRCGMQPFCGCRAQSFIPLMEELGI